MKLASPAIHRACVLGALALAAALGDRARGQDSSLFRVSQQGQPPTSQQGQPSTAQDRQSSTAQDRQPLTLANNSWTAESPQEPHTIKINDLITVIVSLNSTMTSNGQMDRKKTAYGDLALPNWIKFYKFKLGADGQPNGEPHVRGELDNKLQSKADLQTRDSLTFHIACRVADIRPNGNLVLEGRRTINNNEENWDYSLTGEIRADAVLPNHTVLSDSVADLRVIKRETGHVRDGYRRGWALQWMDKWQPF
jgi:flagellar L-ring protein precursor FlgH